MPSPRHKTTSLCPGHLVLAAVLAAAVGCANPVAPAPPDVRAPGGPIEPADIDARVEGRVWDADRDAPVAGALVTFTKVIVDGRFLNVAMPAPAGSTDSEGYYAFDTSLPAEWRQIVLSATRDGYEEIQGFYVLRDASGGGRTLDAASVHMYPTLSLTAGTSVRATTGRHEYVCGWESMWCRRILVDTAEGPIDVELVPDNENDQVGIIATDEPFPFTAYARRVRVTSDAVWLIGYPGRVTLTAHRQ